MNKYIALGFALAVYGLLEEKDAIISAQQELLREVAIDNMALRFHIHNTEVEKNA